MDNNHSSPGSHSLGIDDRSICTMPTFFGTLCKHNVVDICMSHTEIYSSLPLFI